MLIKILNLVYRELKIIRVIGLFQYAKYVLSFTCGTVQIVIAQEKVMVRKGTHDLKVAISSLCGEFNILKHLFDSSYNGIIIDAGGYIGTSAIALKRLYPNAKVIVVEPSEANLEIMKINLAMHTDIKIIYGALVGSPREKIKLKNRFTGEWGYTVVQNPSDRPEAEIMSYVPAYMIGDLVDRPEEIGILKLDIEGGEFEILDQDLLTLEKIYSVFAELHERISPGCEDRFFNFSKSRILIKESGEKYLSIKK